MKQYYLPLIVAIASATSFNVYSKTLSAAEALNRIESSTGIRKIAGDADKYSLIYTLNDASNEPTLYVFDNSKNEGFIILSADDAAIPMLGYSDQGKFDVDNIPPEMTDWLSAYSSQIESARAVKAGESASAQPNPLAGLPAISPLLKSKWNQGAPYNEYCYEISADGTQTKSVTGCVATSMAQVMYYFKQPETGKGTISYKHGDSGEYTMDFGAQPFNWDDMLPTYYPDSYSQTEADAVAYLMKACGYSVKMDYGKGESGADGANIAGALIEYFGYNPNIQVQTRAFYTYEDWAQMIYDNLKNVGPVVYNGSALDGGHSFVCDGYDGNGYFHINWGWGGMSDGYYLLDALNPDEFGIGGAAGGYNLGQQAILNITPETTAGSPAALMQFGTASGEISGTRLSLKLDGTADPGFQYINPAAITLTFGVKVENASNLLQDVQYFESDKKNLKAIQGSRFTWDEDGTALDLSKVNMTEGDEYNFIFATLITDGDNSSSWSETVAQPGKFNYVTVVKSSDGYTVTTHQPRNITVSNFNIESSPVYFNMPVKFSAEFSNDAVQQLTRNYSAVFFNADGKECYKMENYSINVDAGESVTDEWTSVNWYKEDGAADVTEATDFTVKLYDNWIGAYVDGIEEKVTVQPEHAQGKVETSLSIVNGDKEGEIYEIEGDELSVSLTIKVVEGTFNHTVMLALQAQESSGEYFTVMHKHFNAIPQLSEGEEQTLDMTVAFEDAEPGKTYRVEVWGPGDGFKETALVQFQSVVDGVKDIFATDEERAITVYSLDGLLIGSNVDSDFLNTLPGGIYIVNGHKVILSGEY